MRLPFALHEPHTLGAEVAFGEDPLGLAQRRRLGLGIPALGEIPQALATAAPGDRDLAVEVHRHQHQPDAPRTPPAMVALGADGQVFEVAGEEWPFGLEPADDVAPERAILGQELAHPPLALVVPRALPVAHPGADEREILDRVDEGVPLEEGALPPEEPVELGAVVTGPEPAEEHQVLRRRDRGDHVDLEEAESADRREHALCAPVERLRADCDPAGLLGADLHRATSSSPIVRASRRSARSSASSRAPDARTPCSRWKALTTSRPSARSDLRSARPTIRSPRRNGST